VRGAYYKIYKLSDEAKKRGVITASAGNHAQGVAYAASMANVKAKIIMPIFASISKILATKNYGAEVVLYGQLFDEALRKAFEIAETEKLTFIHTFDDPYIIAGHGTIGLEIISQLRDPDIIVVPIGGGGLISGISIAIKKKLGNKVRVIGVQTEAFPAAYEFFKGVELEEKPFATIADGIAIKAPGELNEEIINEFVDDIVLVDDSEIAEAIFLLLERGKTLAEGAGAASLAAIISNKIDVKGRKVVSVISGGNIDFRILVKIINQELVGFKRVIRIRAIIPDRPGALSKMLLILADARINIIDINTNRYDPAIEPYQASIELITEVPEEEKFNRLLEKLKQLGYEVQIMTC